MLQDRMCLFVVKGMEGTIRLVCLRVVLRLGHDVVVVS